MWSRYQTSSDGDRSEGGMKRKRMLVESGVLVVVGARDAVVGRCTRGVEDSSRQEEPLKKEVDGEWL